MKRIISIVLLLVCVLTASAQIQRNFLGFTLGVTTKSVVYNKYKHNKSLQINEDGDLRVSNITFAGQKWDLVLFKFANNKLQAVSFFSTEPNTTITEMDMAWNRLSENLLIKYGKYYRDSSTSEHLMFTDGKTNLSLSYSVIEYYKGLSLFYFDRKLFNQQTQKEFDEL